MIIFFKYFNSFMHQHVIAIQKSFIHLVQDLLIIAMCTDSLAVVAVSFLH
jgi:hypothetical protein